jgi:hypothetical protein
MRLTNAMKALIRRIGVLTIMLLVLLAASQAQAISPMAEFPETSNGIASMTTLTVATSTATIVGTIPSGNRGFIAYAVSADVNYGDSDVATETTELYIPVGKTRYFGPFYDLTPSVYFRIRGTATTTTSLILRAAPRVTNPNGSD